MASTSRMWMLAAGLGVDYDGSQSTAQASVNYSLQEYANDIVYTLAEVCRDPRSADAAHHQRVGPCAHGAPRAAARQRHRRRVGG